MDNASGLAVGAGGDARAGAARSRGFRRGLRVLFFSVEEWALTGSAQYVQSLTAAERGEIALNVNLDSVGGQPEPRGADAAAMPGVEPFLLRVAEANGHRAAHGAAADDQLRPRQLRRWPASRRIRLVAGFDDPAANLRVVLTPADTRDKVGAKRAAPGHAPHRRPGCRRLQRRSGRSREVAQPLVVDEAVRQARSQVFHIEVPSDQHQAVRARSRGRLPRA